MRTLKALSPSFAVVVGVMALSALLIWAADSNFWWGGEAYQLSRKIEKWAGLALFSSSAAIALISVMMCTREFAQSLRFGVVSLLLTGFWAALALAVGSNVHSWTGILISPVFFSALASVVFFLHAVVRSVKKGETE